MIYQNVKIIIPFGLDIVSRVSTKAPIIICRSFAALKEGSTSISTASLPIGCYELVAG